MSGTIALLAEVLVFKGVGVGNMGAGSRDEVVALVGGVGVAALKRPEGELGVGDGVIWEE